MTIFSNPRLSTLAVSLFAAFLMLGVVVSVEAATTFGGDPYHEDETTSLSRRLSVGTGQSTGDFNYSYPLKIPPGRNGFQPDIQLSYSSNTTDDQSPFGFGWSVPIPYIERVNKEGVENLYNKTYFFSSLDGELASTTSQQYGPKVENGDFRKYQFATSTSGWTLTDKSGIIYKFGHATSTRLDDPNNGYKVYRWYLQEIRDTNENYMSYTYFKEKGQVYIATSTYTGNGVSDGSFKVEFYHEMRSDIATSSSPGFFVQSRRRINEIQASINGSWVRKYELAYTTGDNGVRSLLDTITETGRDEAGNTTSLPVVNFNYQNSANTWVENATWQSSQYPMFISAGPESEGTEIVDVNGDGLADMVKAKSGENYQIYLNEGDDTGWDSANNGHGTSTIDALVDSNGNDIGTRFVDVNGDGFVDQLRGEQGILVAFINNGDGSGWTQNSTWAPPTYFVDSNQDDAGLRIGDVNGDGLPDLLKYAGSTKAIYINDGSGWNEDSTWDSSPEVFVQADGSDAGTRVIDLNGDGLADVVRYDGSTNKAYLNNGKKGWNENASWNLPEAFLSGSEANGVRFADVNGDGLVDLVRSDTQQGDNRTVYLNTGKGWASDLSWSIPWHFTDTLGADEGARIDDVNGDGIADIVVGDGTEKKVFLNAGKKSDFLSKIIHSEGGRTVVSYKAAQQYISGSRPLSPHLPFVVYTVETTGEHDGLSATTSSMTYEYRGGDYYYGFVRDRKFSGFGTTTATNAAGFVSKTFFHQGNDTDSGKGESTDDISKLGKPYRVEQYDASSNLYAKAINTWENYDLGYKRDFVKLTQKMDFSYDGDSDHADKAEEYTYSDSNGNLTQKIEWGKVTGNDNGTFTDTLSDKFITDLTYAASTTPYIVGLLSREITKDQSTTTVKDTKLYYDDLANGSVDVGNETKRELWKSSSNYASTTRAYNAYGLVTEETDGLGHETTYTYDTFNLYAATSTNPVGHVTGYAYDYSIGKPKRVQNPNGFIFETTYDGLDRVTAEKQPDLTTPTTRVTKTAYTYTDWQPRNVQETHNLDGSTSFLVYKYFDGFGRIKQERKEAEDLWYAVRDYTYNNRGLLQKDSLPYFSLGTATTTATTTTALFTTYTYDALGRINGVKNAVGSTTYAYDDWKTTVTDVASNTKDLTRNIYGRLSQVDEYNSATYTTAYEYNYLGNLTKITDAAANIRNFTYDGLGRRLTAEDLHDTGDVTYGSWSYTYDDAGNISSLTNPDSKTVDYTYDDINRPLTENYTGAGGTEISFAYDICSNGKGFLCGATTTAASTHYGYNALGGMASEIKTVSNADYTTGYDYNYQGSQTTMTYPDSSVVKYEYNTAGLLEKVFRKEDTDAGYTNVITDFDYSPAEQVMLQVYKNGVQTTREYDKTTLYRLKHLDTQSSGAGGAGLFEDPGYLISLAQATSTPELTVDATTTPDIIEDAASVDIAVEADSATSTPAEITEALIEDTASSSPETIVQEESPVEVGVIPEESVVVSEQSTSTTTPEVILDKAEIKKSNKNELETRNWNSITRPLEVNEDGVPTMLESEFHSKWINYLSSEGWKPIDTTITLSADSSIFEMRNAPFQAEFPLRSTGTAKMINDNRWDVFKAKTITTPSLTMSITAVGVNDVAGRIITGDLYVPAGERKNITYVLYENAYPEGDLIYYVDHARAPRLEKLVRVKSQPTRLEYAFDIELSGPHSVQKEKGKPFSIRSEEDRGFGFKKFQIWDSSLRSLEGEGNVQEIEVNVQDAGPHSYRLTKVLPQAFFDANPTYPVFTDTTSTFYPDPDAESTSVDGYVWRNSVDESWSSIHDAANGTDASDAGSATNMGIRTSTTNNQWSRISRAFTLFDTSSIPDTDSITSATLDLNGADDNDNFSQSIAIVTVNPASNTSLSTSDFDNVGTTDQATRMTVATWASGSHNVFNLNSTGLSNISKTSVTKFGQRLSADADNSAPTWASNTQGSAAAETADVAGTSVDPKLTVVHEPVNQAPTTPTALEVEGQTNPSNVTDPTPEFSAIYNDPDSGDLAPYYRIQVSTSSLGNWTHALWDSGTSTMATTTQGNESPSISYAGSALASSTTYYWRIKFSDDSRKEGAWSTATSTFSLAAAATTGGYQNLTYTYDLLGNITRIQDASDTDTYKIVDYRYDKLYRLKSATSTNATTTQSNFTQTYSYSSIGNIISKSDVGTYTYAGTAYANPHAATDINGATQTYGRNGNLLGNGTWNFRWDYKGQLAKASTTSAVTNFGYDYAGSRVYLKEGNTATTTFANKFYSVSSATTTKHIFANGQLVATVENTNGGGGMGGAGLDEDPGFLIVTSANAGLLETLGISSTPETKKYENVPLTDTLKKDLETRTWNRISTPLEASVIKRGTADTLAEIVPTKFESEFHGKWINYLSEDGWKPIDTSIRLAADGSSFIMTEAPFQASFPLRSTGTARMDNTNKWDVFKNKEINSQPVSMIIVARDVNDVPGRIVQGDLVTPAGLRKTVTYVVYEGAYPEGDLIYYIDYGRAPRLDKLVRINTSPSRLDYAFDISFSQNHTIREKQGKVKGFEVENDRGFGFKPFQIWDSSVGIDARNVQEISATFETVSANSYRLTKQLPQSFFDANPVYPVYTDTISTFYPNPDAESTSVDGYVWRNSVDETWSAIHDASAGTFAGDDLSALNVNLSTSGTSNQWDRMGRGFLLFDTSSITDNDVIDSATFSIDGDGGTDGFNQSGCLVDSTPASNTSIVAGDYDQLGTTLYADCLDLGSWSTSSYNNFSLNATGLAAITTTGVTKFGWRLSSDRENSAPTWTANTDADASPHSADVAGTSVDPKLVIVHHEFNYSPGVPTSLEVESKTNPTDVNDHTPEFSAIYNDQNGGDYATWYRIQVSTSSLGHWAHAKWDSGTSTMATTTESTRSPQISYGGSLLASSTTHYWRIRFSDDDRKEGAWSTATSTFYIDTSCNCATTTVYYIHTDHLSGSNAITNDAGSLVQTLDYYPFGGIRLNTREGEIDERRKFTGHEYDASTGLSYMGARYQSGTQGRFLSQDPAGWNRVEKLVSDPQLLNSYAYARNNPIAMVDRDGELPHLVVAAGVGAIINVGILGTSDLITGQFSGWNAYGGAAAGGAVEGFLVGSGVGLVLSGGLGGAAEGAAREGLDYFVGDGKFQGGAVAKEGATGFVSSFLGNQLTKRLGDVAVPAITKGQGSFAHVANTQMTKLANNTIGSVSPTTFGKMVVSNAVGGAYTHGTNVGLNVGASGYGNYQSSPMIYESLQYQINQLQKQVAEIQRVVGSLKK